MIFPMLVETSTRATLMATITLVSHSTMCNVSSFVLQSPPKSISSTSGAVDERLLELSFIGFDSRNRGMKEKYYNSHNINIELFQKLFPTSHVEDRFWKMYTYWKFRKFREFTDSAVNYEWASILTNIQWYHSASFEGNSTGYLIVFLKKTSLRRGLRSCF